MNPRHEKKLIADHLDHIARLSKRREMVRAHPQPVPKVLTEIHDGAGEDIDRRRLEIAAAIRRLNQ